MTSGLVTAVRAELRTLADPARAPQMQAYMKSAMPYLGVPVPAVRACVKALVKRHPLGSAAEAGGAAEALWDGAEFREERYAAAALTALPVARGALDLLPLHEKMVVTGAWWDHVDEAAHRFGELLAAHPEQLRPLLLAWSTDGNLWRRRISVIAQLGAKAATDGALLTTVVENNLSDNEFFIRKAIGWALRDYAKSEPEWVAEFVAAHPGLSPLSRREALKHLAARD